MSIPQRICRCITGQFIYIVRSFDIVHKLNHIGWTDGKSTAYPSKSECFGKSLEYNNVVKFSDEGCGGGDGGKVDVGFVDDYKAFVFRGGGDGTNVRYGDGFGCWISGRADEKKLCLRCDCLENLWNLQIKIRRQRNCLNRHIIDICTNFVHPIGWRSHHNRIPTTSRGTGRTKNTNQQVDCLIAAHSHEHVLGTDSPAPIVAEKLFNCPLVGTGIPFQQHGVVIGIERVGREGSGSESIFVCVE
mmetsp:Transcript_2210/g.4004  ORF Transcript_2210/g.4004 Transcript_2210/m.4004 type:complete len:245 (-) Transcript_2210:355-1089(-)